MPLAAASRYARALVDIVTGPKSDTQPRQALEGLRAFQSLYSGSPELQTVLLTPAVPLSRKRAVVERFAGSLGLSRLLRNFLFVLIDHRRVAVLDEVIDSFENLLDERLGQVRADVTSAAGLSEPQRAAVQAQLSRLTGKQVRCEFSVDAALLGGAVARVGSAVYDGSVRGQLAALRRRLATD